MGGGGDSAREELEGRRPGRSYRMKEVKAERMTYGEKGGIICTGEGLQHTESSVVHSFDELYLPERKHPITTYEK